MSLWTKYEKMEENTAAGSDLGGAPTAPAAPSTPAPAAPTPAPASASPAPSDKLSETQISDLLSFDPFKPTASPTPDAPPAVPGTTAAPAAATPTPSPTADPEKVLLQQQLAELQKQINASKTAPAAPAAPAAPTSPADNIPGYDFTVPPELMAALDSEDPAMRTKAIGAVMTGTARAVHQTVMGQFASVMQEMVQSMPNLVQQQIEQATQAKAVFDDFYGTYKDLNVPELRPMILEVTKSIVAETGAKSWSPALRDAIARRAFQVLGRQVPGMAPMAPAAPFNPTGAPVRPAAPTQPSFLEQVGF